MSERDSPSTQMPRHDLPEPGDPRYRDTLPENVMGQHHAVTGSARGIGSVGFDDPGAFDVGAGEAADDAGTSDLSEPRSFAPTDGAHDAASGPLETGAEFRTDAERVDRDPGDAVDRLSPENARPEGAEAAATERWARERLALGADDAETGNEQSDARRLHGQAASAVDADDAPALDETRGNDSYGSLNNSDGL